MRLAGRTVPEGFKQHKLVGRVDAARPLKKELPGSARVAAVKGATRVSHCSAMSGRMANLTAIKIMMAPRSANVAAALAVRGVSAGEGAGDKTAGRRASRETDRDISYRHEDDASRRTGVGDVPRSGMA